MLENLDDISWKYHLIIYACILSSIELKSGEMTGRLGIQCTARENGDWCLHSDDKNIINFPPRTRYETGSAFLILRRDTRAYSVTQSWQGKLYLQQFVASTIHRMSRRNLGQKAKECSDSGGRNSPNSYIEEAHRIANTVGSGRKTRFERFNTQPVKTILDRVQVHRRGVEKRRSAPSLAKTCKSYCERTSRIPSPRFAPDRFRTNHFIGSLSLLSVSDYPSFPLKQPKSLMGDIHYLTRPSSTFNF